MNHNLFNKVIIFTVLEYLEQQLLKDTYRREELLSILSALRGYRTFHRFTQEESKLIVNIGNTEAVQRLKDIEVDFSIYSISMLNLWVDLIDKKKRPSLNISDKRIKKLHSNLIMDMLGLKQRDEGEYLRIKEIVSQSKQTAKMFVNLMEEGINGKTC